MSKKIGETLIERGHLTQEQLDSALKAQLIFGGHLGTCLIELGHVEERSLGETLAKVNRVPYAGLEILDAVPDSVIAAVPPELAERYNVVPIKLEGRVLSLAMINPRDLGALDEIRFATGFRIEPWVSPEIRIVQALERYYGVARRLRYIAICRELERKRGGKAIEPAANSTPFWCAEGTAPGPALAERQDLEKPTSHSVDLGAEVGTRAVEDSYGYGRSWQEIAQAITPTGETSHEPPAPEAETWLPDPADPPVASPSQEVPEPAPSAPSEPIQSLEEVASMLCHAENRDHAARAVLSYTTPRMARSMLLAVRSQTAFVWDAAGIPMAPGKMQSLEFPVTDGWIFQVLMGREYYRGPVPKNANLVALYEQLNLEPPAEILLIPVHLNDRLVAVFYGDGGPQDRIRGDDREFRRLTWMLSLALNVIIFKAKIRAA